MVVGRRYGGREGGTYHTAGMPTSQPALLLLKHSLQAHWTEDRFPIRGGRRGAHHWGQPRFLQQRGTVLEVPLNRTQK